MSNKYIKSINDNNIVTKSGSIVNYPIFSFKHITRNNKYNIKFFKKSKDKQRAYGALFYLIGEMQQMTWKDFIRLPKEKGMESMKSSELNFYPNDYNLTPDQKVVVIRFNRQKYRVIGIKERIPGASDKEGIDIFHVFGFDFDYSAYDHGK
ncbi:MULTISPECIES: hypothetical protein [Peptoniphilus]|uniref:hypothetical protein n=1 Tax=Peptoniphilus TaxID=162289 RepID=UPI002914C0CF|nr:MULTISPECIES: hypothetical protein [Peptoniphilus]MDU5274412.1 hypothetical protein [Peptoniphilus lacydonensis]